MLMAADKSRSNSQEEQKDEETVQAFGDLVGQEADNSDLCSQSSEEILPNIEEISDVLNWKQVFSDSQIVELVDTSNILNNLGRNSRTRARAERIFKLMNEGKMKRQWELEDPDILDVLGISKDQYRRIKLIMAKLNHRIERDEKRKREKNGK